MVKRKSGGLRRKVEGSLWNNRCPEGHGNMFWMADQDKYFCSHQTHDMDGTKAWWNNEELATARVKEAR
jgi:hypothetical protein